METVRRQDKSARTPASRRTPKTWHRLPRSVGVLDGIPLAIELRGGPRRGISAFSR